jgi:glycosyltransferase involved in cell wall biosynthesis
MARDRRIIHIPRRFAQEEWGGTESVVLNFCRQQAAAGWVPEIHTSRALNPVKKEMWRDILIRRYRYCYPFAGLSEAEVAALDKKGGNLLSLSLFWGLLFRPKVRIYHAHVLKRMGGAVFRAAQLRGRPFVVSLHGNIFDVPKAEADSIVEAQQGHFEWGRPFGMILGSRSLLEQADAVMCVGFSEYEAALKALSHERVYHVPNGVNVDHFSLEGRKRMREQFGLKDDDLLIGCISRIDPQKNQEMLLRVFNRLAGEHSKLNLIISGPVTLPNYEAKLKQMAQEGGFMERIHFAPPVEPESADHAALFASLDAFVLPSRHEPFGIVALEAWAARRPLLAARSGGLRHFVKDGRNGLAFDSDDDAGLEAALKRLLGHPEMASALAQEGRRTVEQSYSWQQVVKQLEEIYEEAERRHQ